VSHSSLSNAVQHPQRRKPVLTLKKPADR